jgi:murein DD-endopeptidase MepM/ murein hydrolase activator NlpD
MKKLRYTILAGVFSAAGFSFLFLSSCTQEVVIIEPVPAPVDHTSYARYLERAGLHDTALGSDWLAASVRALEVPMDINIPYRESVYFDSAKASSVGYRFDVKRGQDITITVNADTQLRYYLDLFRESGSGTSSLQPTDEPEDGNTLTYHINRTGAYLLRVQPELLRGGVITVTIEIDASLAFPIAGLDMNSVISWFGAPRDGGSRRHEGIDIIAPRGTEVVAPVRAYVRRLGVSERGGNVVGLMDEKRKLYIYYAHLDTQAVQSGQWVEPGDVLGTVGNTGNAITTIPHLHFGVYQRDSFSWRGAVDPVDYLKEINGVVPEIIADVSLLGTWVRAKEEALLTNPGLPEAPESSLSRYTLLAVDGASAEFYRVRLPDGRTGYVSRKSVESLEEPLGTDFLENEVVLFDEPDPEASVITQVAVGEALEIYGGFNDYLFVRNAIGVPGWISIP